MHSIFKECYKLLLQTHPEKKVSGVRDLYDHYLQHQCYFDESFPVSQTVEAGLPAYLKLVPLKQLPRRRLHSIMGRAAFIHAIAHIEFNAINLALDACYRFRQMPQAYYHDWLKVASEEATHFSLLQQHLQRLGFD